MFAAYNFGAKTYFVNKAKDFDQFKEKEFDGKTIYKIPGNLQLDDDISLPHGIIWCESEQGETCMISGRDVTLNCSAIICSNADLENCDITIGNILCENFLANSIEIKEHSLGISIGKFLQSTNLINSELKYKANQLDFFIDDYNIIVGNFYLMDKKTIEATNNIELEDEDAQEITFYGGNIIVNKFSSSQKNAISLLAGNMMGSGKFNNCALVTCLGTSYNPDARSSDFSQDLFGYTNQNFGTAISCMKMKDCSFSDTYKRKLMEYTNWDEFIPKQHKSSDLKAGFNEEIFDDLGYISTYNLHCKNVYSPLLSISNYGFIENDLIANSLVSHSNLGNITVSRAIFDFANVYALTAKEVLGNTLIAEKQVKSDTAIFSSKNSIIQVPTFKTNQLVARNSAVILCNNRNEINFEDYNAWSSTSKAADMELEK